MVGALAAAVAYRRPVAIDNGEAWSYDERAKALAASEPASPEVVVVEIGDDDLRWAQENMGVSWPWPRTMHGYLASFAARGAPKAVVFDFLFEDLDKDAAHTEDFAAAMRQAGKVVIGMSMPAGQIAPRASGGRWAVLQGRYPTRSLALDAAMRLSNFGARSYLLPAAGGLELYLGGYEGAEQAEGTLAQLSANPLLESIFQGAPVPVAPRELSERELASEVRAEALLAERDSIAATIPNELELPERGIAPPLGVLAASAAKVANVKQEPDADGILRRYELLACHEGRLWPSLALSAWLVGHPDQRPRFDGAELLLGERRFPLDERGRAILRYPPRAGHRHLAARELLGALGDLEEGRPPRIDPVELKDKYVVVGPFASAMRDVKASPIDRAHPGPEINAAMLDNLLSGKVIRRAGRGEEAAIAFAVALLVAVSVVAVETVVTSTVGALFSGVAVLALLLTGLWGLASWLLRARGLWVPVVVPGGGALLASAAAVLSASGMERRDRRFVQEALGRYTSPALVKELLAHPEYLSLEWGETREISVYFSDIAGFTSFSEKLRPERLVKLLNEYLSEMTDIVLAHGGVVDKYIGDAIMAFWGAPLPEPEHARKAVLSALAMRRRCEQLRAKWKAEFGAEVIARAGINTGQAVAGNMGSRHKFNYTVMGDMVNLASRLEGANKPYGTTLMISETTYEKVREVVEARELDLLAVKGKQKPVTVYEVLCEKGALEPQAVQVMAEYRRGLSLYRGQQFAQASAAFEKALALSPEDGPSRTYLERCRHFLADPPGAGWDGVWHMKEK